MRNTRAFTVLILGTLFLFVSGRIFEIQASEINGKTIKDTIKNLKRADAKKDVAEALNRGDKRFIGIMGFGLIVPVVDEEQKRVGAPNYRETYGVKIIEGTSDNISTRDIEILNYLALRYARQYNKLLLDSIKLLKDGMPSHNHPPNVGSQSSR